jgi:hypothetical protein
MTSMTFRKLIQLFGAMPRAFFKVLGRNKGIAHCATIRPEGRRPSAHQAAEPQRVKLKVRRSSNHGDSSC